MTQNFSRSSSYRLNTGLLLISTLFLGSNAWAKNSTDVSAQVFANLGNLQLNDRTADTEGWAVDVKRFYLDVNHAVDDKWSLRVTTDAHFLRQQSASDIWFRHAYAQYQIDEQQFVKLGVAELPWIDYIARRVGYRYVDPSLSPKNRFAVPTDPGVHYGFKNSDFSFAAAVVTGSGFKKPRLGDSVDVELTGVWHLGSGWDIASGYYQGKRALDKDDRATFHDAKRWNMAVSYMTKQMRFGVEYAYNDNWTHVTQVSPDASDGWSAWASYRFAPSYSAFARYDRTHPSRRLNPTLEREYVQLGMDWKATSYLTVALVAKQSEAADLVLSQKQTEIGSWTMWNF
jgi:hypothetical protein